MSEIIYNPEDVGKEFFNKRGKILRNRKYHLTLPEMKLLRKRWYKETKNISKSIKKRAGNIFFNPYRRGMYHYQVQTLFLLGANKWHDFSDIKNKLKEYTSSMLLSPEIVKKYGYRTEWERFKNKQRKEEVRNGKDHLGRIKENFVMLQRLSKKHPYGYKLYQVCAAIDIRRVSHSCLEHGLYYYRLSTYLTMAEALPIKDFSKYTFSKHESKCINNRFIGTIITKDKVYNG